MLESYQPHKSEIIIKNPPKKIVTIKSPAKKSKPLKRPISNSTKNNFSNSENQNSNRKSTSRFDSPLVKSFLKNPDTIDDNLFSNKGSHSHRGSRNMSLPVKQSNCAKSLVTRVADESFNDTAFKRGKYLCILYIYQVNISLYSYLLELSKHVYIKLN